MNDFYVIPNNKDVVFNNLILPLKDYSIGFDVYYTVSEINSLSKKLNISVIYPLRLINIFFTTSKISVCFSFLL